jgi:hypothetical protein
MTGSVQPDRETLLEIVKRALRERGYEEVEPNPTGGGVWTHPDWDGGTDGIVPAITDCFERGL